MGAVNACGCATGGYVGWGLRVRVAALMARNELPAFRSGRQLIPSFKVRDWHVVSVSIAVVTRGHVTRLPGASAPL